jgi:type I restriction enzyme S subunit
MVKEGYKEVRIGPKTKLIPEEWKVNKLKKIIKKRKGKRPNKLFESKDGENFIPYLSVNYLRGNDLPEWCLKNDDNKVEVKENEILMIWDGSYSGNVFIGFNGALSSTMARLKCEDDIDNQYLFYQLRNNFKIFQSTTIGTSVPHVAGKVFENLNIPTPEKKEQKKIASILSSVDKSIEKTDEVIEETKELKKGLMQELLTKGIGHSEFKDSQFGKIPKSWKIEPLNKIAEVTGGNTPRRSTEEYWGGDIPWLTPSQLTGEIINEIDKTDEYITEKGFKNSSVKLLPVGTVMLTSRATIGETVINKVPMTTNQGFANIICKDDKLFNYFVLYLLRYLTPKLEALAGGSTFLEISRTSVRSLNIPVPPLEEQKKIASILSSVDAKIKKEEEYKEKLERLKKGLMQKLLTGEIRVNTEMEV